MLDKNEPKQPALKAKDVTIIPSSLSIVTIGTGQSAMGQPQMSFFVLGMGDDERVYSYNNKAKVWSIWE